MNMRVASDMLLSNLMCDLGFLFGDFLGFSSVDEGCFLDGTGWPFLEGGGAKSLLGLGLLGLLF